MPAMLEGQLDDGGHQSPWSLHHRQLSERRRTGLAGPGRRVRVRNRVLLRHSGVDVRAGEATEVIVELRRR